MNVEHHKYSPDLNIIENLWVILKNHLSKYLKREQVYNSEDLWKRIIDVKEKENTSNIIERLFVLIFIYLYLLISNRKILNF